MSTNPSGNPTISQDLLEEAVEKASTDKLSKNLNTIVERKINR